MQVTQPDTIQAPGTATSATSSPSLEPTREGSGHPLLERGATLIRTVTLSGTATAPALPKPKANQSVLFFMMFIENRRSGKNV